MEYLVRISALVFFFLIFKAGHCNSQNTNIDSLIDNYFVILKDFESIEFSTENTNFMIEATEKRNLVVEFFTNISCIPPPCDYHYGVTFKIDDTLIMKWNNWYEINKHLLVYKEDALKISPKFKYEKINYYQDYPFGVRLKNVVTVIPRWHAPCGN